MSFAKWQSRLYVAVRILVHVFWTIHCESKKYVSFNVYKQNYVSFHVYKHKNRYDICNKNIYSSHPGSQKLFVY